MSLEISLHPDKLKFRRDVFMDLFDLGAMVESILRHVQFLREAGSTDLNEFWILQHLDRRFPS